MSNQPTKRLLSLDVMRGITIAGMILVSNPGTWDYFYAPLGHSPWHHITPTDLVFPFFMFIMGVSIYISLTKTNFEWTKKGAFKIFRRTFLLILIGAALIWFSVFCWKFSSLSTDHVPFFERLYQSVFCLNHIPITGVLPRLGITYGIATIITILVRHKYIPYIVASALVVYLIILLAGNGFANDRTSILSIVDYWVLGANYMEGRVIDSEGILSTLPAIAHVLIGVCCGKVIQEKKTLQDKMIPLFLIGSLLTMGGLLLEYACPINKLIWSPTFVLVSCGLASLLLGVLMWCIDVKQWKRSSIAFEVFGINPLFLYILSHVIAALLDSVTLTYNAAEKSIHEIVYWQMLFPVFGGKLGSLVYAILFVALNWLVGLVLYKKKIYIKI